MKIKDRVEELYKVIKYAEDELKEIRSYCPHKNISMGLYQWRVGSIAEELICDDCGKVLERNSENTIGELEFGSNEL